MFKWLQHLFTLRAIEKENKELISKVKALEVTVSQLQNEHDNHRKAYNDLQQQYHRLENELNEFKEHRRDVEFTKPLKYPNL